MNVRDINQYPQKVQDEVRASVRRVAAGHFTEWCPEWIERVAVLRWLWGAKESVRRWFRVRWRLIVGPNQEMLDAIPPPTVTQPDGSTGEVR